MYKKLITLLLITACMFSAESLAGKNAQIFLIGKDGTYSEGRLSFSRYEMKVGGSVNVNIGLTGGDYTIDKDKTFTCMTTPKLNGIDKIVWKGKIVEVDKLQYAEGSVTITPSNAKYPVTTFTFKSERPRPNGKTEKK